MALGVHCDADTRGHWLTMHSPVAHEQALESQHRHAIAADNELKALLAVNSNGAGQMKVTVFSAI